MVILFLPTIRLWTLWNGDFIFFLNTDDNDDVGDDDDNDGKDDQDKDDHKKTTTRWKINFFLLVLSFAHLEKLKVNNVNLLLLSLYHN